MRPIVQLAVPAAVAVALLLAADWILQPVPVPAATAVLGGLLGLGWGRGAGWGRAAWGVVAGLLAGVGLHLWVHRAGGSPAPDEGLWAHLAADGAVALGVGLGVVTASVLAQRALVRGSSGGQEEEPSRSAATRPG
jgi:hypothetical protein